MDTLENKAGSFQESFLDIVTTKKEKRKRKEWGKEMSLKNEQIKSRERREKRGKRDEWRGEKRERKRREREIKETNVLALVSKKIRPI